MGVCAREVISNDVKRTHGSVGGTFRQPFPTFPSRKETYHHFLLLPEFTQTPRVNGTTDRQHCPSADPKPAEHLHVLPESQEETR